MIDADVFEIIQKERVSNAEQIEAACVPIGYVVFLVDAWQKLQPYSQDWSNTEGQCICVFLSLLVCV